MRYARQLWRRLKIAHQATTLPSFKPKFPIQSFLSLALGTTMAYALWDENFIVRAVEAAAPAVINITIHSRSNGQLISSGSGFVLESNGLLVTNAHVVDSPVPHSRIEVTLADGTCYPATIHAMDRRTDLALLQIQAQQLPVLPLGSSSTLSAGQWVVALGSPLRLQNSVSAGIVSAVARDGVDFGAHEYIQTDAAVNVGNSGGPLVNLKGECIGITSLKVAASDGISFAIPSDVAAPLLEQLKCHGKIIRPYIGMQLVQFNSSSLKRFCTPNRPQGVVVAHVSKGSPADVAGLKEKDIIVRFDGMDIVKSKQIVNRIGHKVDRKINLYVVREGSTKPIALTLIPKEATRHQFSH